MATVDVTLINNLRTYLWKPLFVVFDIRAL